MAVLTIGAVASAQPGQPTPPSATPPPPAGTPTADRPLIRSIPTPTLSFEGGAGVVGYPGGAAAVGPGWQVRVAGKLTDRWTLEGSYFGAANKRPDTGTSIVTSQFDAGARYNLLLANQAPVQPFVAAGIGFANYAGQFGAPAALVLPVSVGADRMLTPSIRIGARLAYRPAFGEDLSSPAQRRAGTAPGGDTWLLTGNLGGAF